MNVIASFFLRAKHWQMFLLLFGLMFISQVAVVMNPTLLAVRSPADLGKADLLPGVPMAIFMICFLGWFWAMGSLLSSVVPSTLRLRMGFFRLALIYPLVYMPFFIFIMFSDGPKPAMVVLILPLHLFAMFCLFYDLYYVSKGLALAETGKPVSFYDYAGPFFLLWFFPIGIWVIQPRINRIYAQKCSAEPIIGANPV
jgi:glucan phosphoethanolaminetransferase (alkaline phosphatase superfamily)